MCIAFMFFLITLLAYDIPFCVTRIKSRKFGHFDLLFCCHAAGVYTISINNLHNGKAGRENIQKELLNMYKKE